MDTSEQRIKMCEKAEEIQKEWRDTNRNYIGDCIFVESFKYYHRTIKKHVSKFQLRDTEKENPGWVKSHNGIRGICTIDYFVYKYNHIETDKSYPPTAMLLSVLRPRNPILDEEYLPIEWCIWLPRQDQLQEMIEFLIGDINDNFWSVLGDISQWAFDFQHEDFKTYIPLSMDQLWLAFVMKEKHGKVWDGDKWLKQ